MPLDFSAQSLTVFQADVADTLHQLYGALPFTAPRAAERMNRPRPSIAAMVAILIIKGVLERLEPGFFRFIDPGARTPVQPVADAPVKSEPAIIMPGPIKDLPHALAYLNQCGVPVAPAGAVFTIDHRRRATEEQVIVIAENRRSRSVRYPDRPVRRFGGLPTTLERPTAAQLMGGR